MANSKNKTLNRPPVLDESNIGGRFFRRRKRLSGIYHAATRNGFILKTNVYKSLKSRRIYRTRI